MGFWDIFNSVPIIGHVKAAVEAISGDTESARRTAASATGGLLSTVGAVGGFIVGGPPGAIAGSTCCSVLGGQLESLIKGDGLDLSPAKLGTDAGFGAVGGLLGGGGAAVGSISRGIAQGTGREVAKQVMKGVVQKTAGGIVSTMGGQVFVQVGKEVIGQSTGGDTRGDVETGTGTGTRIGGGPKPHDPEEEDPDVDEKLIDVVSREQDRLAREIERFVADFPERYSTRWPAIGWTTPERANIGDAYNNCLVPCLSTFVKHGEPFKPAYDAFMNTAEDCCTRLDDGRVERAKVIMANMPMIGAPVPSDLDDFVQGLKERIYALSADFIDPGAERVPRPF